jgi:FkbM family methyltransferase
MWIPDNDPFFEGVFGRTGDKFDYASYEAVLDCLPKERRRFAIDVGAHVGSWTRQMSRDFEYVYAFEPVKPNYECLTKNTQYLQNVLLKNMGLSNARGNLFFGAGPENSGQYHVSDDTTDMISEVVPLDEYLKGRDIHALDFLKIDVEGYEINVLQGAAETIRRFTPVILIEQNGLAARYFGYPDSIAADYLLTLGMKLVKTVNKDLIFSW